MPILQASIKHARQSEERRARRQPFKSRMKSGIRKIQDLVKDGKNADAEKELASAMKSIDTAAKKNLIHWKNAAKKKSALQKLVTSKKK
jgi:small subunit ribosomal protein S20